MRLSTMSSLFSRRDVVVVASVSCIYGIGSKEDYEAMVIPMRVGQDIVARTISVAAGGSAIHAQRHRIHARTISACAATRWNSVPPGARTRLRIEFFGEEIERITRFEPLTGNKIETLDGGRRFFPANNSSRRREDEARRSWPSARNWASASRGLRSTANCSRRSASRCARNTIWK